MTTDDDELRSTWGYRVVRHEGAPDLYSIHEVYYRGEQIESMTINAVRPGGDSPEELRRDLEMMLADSRLPVLTYGDVADPAS